MRARFAAALIAVGAALLSTACTPLRPLVTPAIVATDPHETIATYQGQLSIKLQAFQTQPAKGVSMGFFFQGPIVTGGQSDRVGGMEGQNGLLCLLPKQCGENQIRSRLALSFVPSVR